MPKKQTEGAAAFDLYLPEDVYVHYGRQLIDLKFSIELPKGYAATIQPRSGFSAKGIECMYDLSKREMTCYKCRLDADVIRGLIDEDFRGNVHIILNNHEYVSLQKFIPKGTRIAQMQIVEVPQVEFVQVSELSETERGEGGIGSTRAK